MSPILSSRALKALPFLLAVAASSEAHAQTVFFTGTSNAPWSVDTNWSTGAKPTASQIAGINGNSGGTGSGGVILLDQNADAGGISFSGSVGKTLALSSGAGLTLHGTLVSSTMTLVSNAGNQNLSISGSGSLVLANSGAFNVTNGNRTLAVSTRITETGGPRQIIKTGAGALQLTNLAGSSTYSGGFWFKEGTVNTNVGTTGAANAPTQGAFGTGTITFEGGTALNYTGNAAGTIHNRVSLAGDVTIGNGLQVQTLTLAGDIDLGNGTRALTLNQGVVASGVLSAGALTKSGSSQLQLTGINTYLGATRIAAGTLSLSGSGSIASSSRIEVASGATFDAANGYALATGQVLTGAGTVTGTLRTGSGTVEAGLDGIGQLSVEGNGVFDGGAIRFELSDSGHDQIVFSGNGLSLTGNTSGAVRLTLSDFDGTAAPGEYLLVSTSGLTGAALTNWSAAAFSLETLPANWTGALRLDGNGLYFDLQTIPEPSTYALLLGAAGLLGIFRRSRKTRE